MLGHCHGAIKSFFLLEQVKYSFLSFLNIECPVRNCSHYCHPVLLCKLELFQIILLCCKLSIQNSFLKLALCHSIKHGLVYDMKQSQISTNNRSSGNDNSKKYRVFFSTSSSDSIIYISVLFEYISSHSPPLPPGLFIC